MVTGQVAGSCGRWFDDMDLCAISLFSGVGMLDEGVRAGLAYLGVGHRTICHVEREAHAGAVLAARMEEGSLDAAPIWTDVSTFDAAAWRGRVDCIVAGFPCQDLSVAGRRAGLDGKRSGLFFEVVRIAADSGAWLLFLENVAGIATATASVVDPEEGALDERAAARVVGELADLGWDAEWLTLSASDVGACHGRARWFCLAWRHMADGDGEQLRPDVGRPIAGPDGRDHATGGGSELGNARHSASRDRGAREAGGATFEGGCRVLEPADAGRVLELAQGQRRREGRPQSAGQQGRCDAAKSGGLVANTDRSPDERRGRPGAVEGARGALESEGHERQRRRHTADGGGSCVADALSTRSQVGSGGEATLKHLQTHSPSLGAFIEHSASSLPALQTQHGEKSSLSTQNSPRRLNPLFAAWLMGWPSTWVIAEPNACGPSATELWRSKLQQRLSSLLDERASSPNNTN
jgi:DNA (cytosine-5)-methyltransferase 1